MYNCLIIDDDEIDRLTLSFLVKKFPEFNIVQCCSNTASAENYIKNGTIDVLFIDIKMPTMSGIEFRKKNQHIPVCIFITSHPEFALESFEIDTLDYLIKPVNFYRFAETIKKIRNYLEIRTKASLFESSVGYNTIFIKEGKNYTKVQFHEILYLEALKDYTILATAQKKHTVLKSLGKLLEDETYKSFIRVHRGFAVQRHFINHINTKEVVLKNNISIPLGKFYKENIESLL